ncbi:MAG: hypothetical protein K940chlam8_00895, partial [Chlamydiae bacterium]|nr:hypothetical protein [Chlamydiota bacterium]
MSSSWFTPQGWVDTNRLLGQFFAGLDAHVYPHLPKFLEIIKEVKGPLLDLSSNLQPMIYRTVVFESKLTRKEITGALEALAKVGTHFSLVQLGKTPINHQVPIREV